MSIGDDDAGTAADDFYDDVGMELDAADEFLEVMGHEDDDNDCLRLEMCTTIYDVVSILINAVKSLASIEIRLQRCVERDKQSLSQIKSPPENVKWATMADLVSLPAMVPSDQQNIDTPLAKACVSYGHMSRSELRVVLTEWLEGKRLAPDPSDDLIDEDSLVAPAVQRAFNFKDRISAMHPSLDLVDQNHYMDDGTNSPIPLHVAGNVAVVPVAYNLWKPGRLPEVRLSKFPLRPSYAGHTNGQISARLAHQAKLNTGPFAALLNHLGPYNQALCSRKVVTPAKGTVS